ncbi:hypothetical protein GCM10011609_22480 [Lentzea pudingi]|uniref:Uncharacterized protein n=1 Tax=Lentzea pudingi TaxID=1789439 RepID=A0ABQ2HLW3_9PSEU|nr:hypothetical protein [Lentzea pudingi]GGM85780.1 hypothetical protein GCM10011609_22480 [Lentzea pudingi]
MRFSPLHQAIRDALALLRVTAGADLADRAEQARRRLAEAVTAVPDAPPRALTHIAEADEHLEYGELAEARRSLTAARRLVPGHLSVVPARA